MTTTAPITATTTTRTTTRTTAGPAGARVPDPVTAHRITPLRVLHGEWMRLSGLRSHRWTLGAALVLHAAVGISSAYVLSSSGVADGFSDASDPTGIALDGTLISQLLLGALGAVVVTSDYATGSMRAILAAVPRRPCVLAARALIVAVAVGLGTLVATGLSFAVGQQLFVASGEPTASLSAPGVLRALLAGPAYLAGVALIGAALGFLLRSTAAAIAAVVTGTYLLPELLRLVVPASVYDPVGRFLPSAAGEAMYSTVPDPDAFTPGVAALVFVAWVAGLLTMAAISFVRRDA